MAFLFKCRSPKLKPFWLSLQEKDDYVPILDYLTKALLGSASDANLGKLDSDAEWSAPEYESAMRRALKISTCPIVPFFGAYLRELRTVLSTPSLIVLSSGSEQYQLQVRQRSWCTDAHGLFYQALIITILLLSHLRIRTRTMTTLQKLGRAVC